MQFSRLGARVEKSGTNPGEESPGCGLDLTPLVGITLQLAVFLLVLFNYSLGGQDESIRLPGSELARPPATRLESLITVQLTSKGTVLLGGEETAMGRLEPLLRAQRDALELQGRSPARTTVIVRADRDAPTGKVQELIEIGQKLGFDRFILRARDDGRFEP